MPNTTISLPDNVLPFIAGLRAVLGYARVAGAVPSPYPAAQPISSSWISCFTSPSR